MTCPKKIWRICILFLTFLYICTLYSTFTALQNNNKYRLKFQIDQVNSVNFQHVVVHIDLKGAPPKLKYLERLLPTFQQLGVNGILLEYEDMFPYEGRLINLSSVYCYNKNELKSFLRKVDSFGIEIIPLVQTSGHMEHALKLREFQHLRESASYPDSICPSKNESHELVRDMIQQVIQFHSNITKLKHVHIGCDEVFQLKVCDICSSRKEQGIAILLEFIQKTRQFILDISPQTTVLMWDDMLRTLEARVMRSRNKNWLNNMEVVYWDYTATIITSNHNMYYYYRTLQKFWIASAFKGADGKDASLPIFKTRFSNTFQWLNLTKCVINKMINNNFTGIILTGWSRFSHMDPLCELLPVSMPTLFSSLLAIKRFRIIKKEINDEKEYFQKYISEDLFRLLQCGNKLMYIGDYNAVSRFCAFEGSNLLKLLYAYKTMKEAGHKFMMESSVLPSIEYYAPYTYLNRNNINETWQWFHNMLNLIENWELDMTIEMSKYYESFVIDEYINSKVYLIKENLKAILRKIDVSLKTYYWERRSYNKSHVML